MVIHLPIEYYTGTGKLEEIKFKVISAMVLQKPSLSISFRKIWISPYKTLCKHNFASKINPLCIM